MLILFLQVEELRSIDNIYVVIKQVPNLEFTGNDLVSSVSYPELVSEISMDVLSARVMYVKTCKFSTYFLLFCVNSCYLQFP